MKNKYSLSFIPIILLTLPSMSYAMGIGDINVSSHLGEPFRASVNITSALAELESDCFKLNQTADGNDGAASSLNANLILKKISSDDYKLIISTFRSIEEPILELVLSSDCGNNSSRQYTVLLDPSINEVAIAAPNVANDVTTATEQPKIVKLRKTVKKHRAKKRKSVTTPQSQTVQAPVQTLPSPFVTPSTNAGRLVVSAGTSNFNTGTNNLSLMLDNNLQQNAAPNSQQLPPFNTSIESDDITALKLQIAQLEKRNLELEAAIGAELATSPANPSPTLDAQQAAINVKAAPAKKLIKPEVAESTPWLLYLLIAAFIIAVAVVLDLLRRRNNRLALATDLDLSESAFSEEIHGNSRKKSPATAFGHSSFGHSSQYSSGAQIEIEHNSQDDVLREVEVFMALGRNNLAIKLLQANVREFPKDSPSNWLLLLDLLKQENLPTEYADTTEKCKNIFNLYISPFDESDIADNSTLGDHPHVEEKLEEVWGTDKMLPYLEEIIYNSRTEARRGFFKNVYLELLLLHKIAQTRDRFDDSNVQSVSNSASLLNDTLLKAKLDEAYSRTSEVNPNLVLDADSVAIDLDSEMTKREADASNEKDFDAFNLNLSTDFAAPTDTNILNGEMNVLDIPLEFDLSDRSVNKDSESSLENELAEFAEQQAEHEKKANPVISFDLLELDETSSPELPNDTKVNARKHTNKSTKKLDPS